MRCGGERVGTKASPPQEGGEEEGGQRLAQCGRLAEKLIPRETLTQSGTLGPEVRLLERSAPRALGPHPAPAPLSRPRSAGFFRELHGLKKATQGLWISVPSHYKKATGYRQSECLRDGAELNFKRLQCEVLKTLGFRGRPQFP